MAEKPKHFMNTLRALLWVDEPTDPHKAARWRWLHKTASAWEAANQKVTAAWDLMLAVLPDDISDEDLEALDLPDPPEEAEVNALWEQLNDVIQKDLWPKELYFGCI